MRHGVILLWALLAACRPLQAAILWEGSGGWNFGGTNSFGGLTQPANPPARVTSGGDFSNGGALCPSPDTPDFICGFFLGESDLAPGPGGGGRVLLRASARLRQKSFTSVGGGKIVHAGGRVTITGFKFSSVASPTSQVVFHFGLHGTRLETTNNGQVTVVGRATAYLSADTQRFVQCFADVCEPIRVPVGANGWDPGAPNGTVILVDLRSDASITAPVGVVYDAEAIADFQDTLEILAIEAQDAGGVPVPGVSLLITDNQGQPIYEFPTVVPTTTTTVVTTTMVTTTIPGTTTTSTLPANCDGGATFVSVACRLGKLLESVQAATDGDVESKLTGKVAGVQRAIAAAEQLQGSAGKQASRQLGKALAGLDGFVRVLKSRAAKRALDKDARAALVEPVRALRVDVKTLRRQ